MQKYRQDEFDGIINEPGFEHTYIAINAPDGGKNVHTKKQMKKKMPRTTGREGIIKINDARRKKKGKLEGLTKKRAREAEL